MLQIKNFQNCDDWLPMFGSEALGMNLVKSGNFAADMLRFKPQERTSLHTHPGNHILFVVEGDGCLVFDGQLYELTKNTCYFVPGSTPHQVIGGDVGMFLMSIADSHRPVDSTERLTVVDEAWNR